MRKVRCMLLDGGPSERCTNCVRLKKDCNVRQIKPSATAHHNSVPNPDASSQSTSSQPPELSPTIPTGSPDISFPTEPSEPDQSEEECFHSPNSTAHYHPNSGKHDQQEDVGAIGTEEQTPDLDDPASTVEAIYLEAVENDGEDLISIPRHTVKDAVLKINLPIALWYIAAAGLYLYVHIGSALSADPQRGTSSRSSLTMHHQTLFQHPNIDRDKNTSGDWRTRWGYTTGVTGAEVAIIGLCYIYLRQYCDIILLFASSKRRKRTRNPLDLTLEALFETLHAGLLDYLGPKCITFTRKSFLTVRRFFACRSVCRPFKSCGTRN